MRGRLLRCGWSPGRRGPGSQHAEFVAAAGSNMMKMMMCFGPPSRGLHQNVGERGCTFASEGVYLCVRVHNYTNAFARRGESQHSGLLSSKTMISIKCRCFLRLKCLQQTPPACFHRQVTVTSCSHKEVQAGGGGEPELQCCVSFCFIRFREILFFCLKQNIFLQCRQQNQQKKKQQFYFQS